MQSQLARWFKPCTVSICDARQSVILPSRSAQVLTVVVKSYKPYVIATPEDFRELLMEAGKLSRLSHP